MTRSNNLFDPPKRAFFAIFSRKRGCKKRWEDISKTVTYYTATYYKYCSFLAFFWGKDTLAQKIARKRAEKCQLIKHLRVLP
jgi:hypothetical protein